MASVIRQLICVLLIFIICESPLHAVRDEKNQGRWDTPMHDKGPDKNVPGFLINMGPTGARAILEKQAFVVKYIFPGSPAQGQLQINDVVTGTFGQTFQKHTFGGGGAAGLEGPLMDLGLAIEKAEGGDGQLVLNVLRRKSPIEVVIPLETLGPFSATFPENCNKSDTLRLRAVRYMLKNGARERSPQIRCMMNLALLTSDDEACRQKAQSNILAWQDVPGDTAWTWGIAFQLIALTEYHLYSQDKTVLPTIEKISQRLRRNQYKGEIEVWKSEWRENEQLYHGGFGHKPYNRGVGKNGYGPMQFTTILAVIGWQLTELCGVDVEDDWIRSALDFIHRGTAHSGYVAYGGEFTLNNGPIDPVRWKNNTSRNYCSRSGAAYIAHKFSPEYPNSVEYMEKYKSNIAQNHFSLADNHGDPIMALNFGLLGTAATQDNKLKREVFDYFKAWVNLSRNHDGSFATQPGRDYADESIGMDAQRFHTTSVMALFLGLGNPKLQIQSVALAIPGVNHKKLKGAELTAYQAMSDKNYGQAARALKTLPGFPQEYQGPSLQHAEGSTLQRMMHVIDVHTESTLKDLRGLHQRGQWHLLQQQIRKSDEQYAGVPQYDKLVADYALQMKDPTGLTLIQADKLFHTGDYGKAWSLLHTLTPPPSYQKIVKQLQNSLDQQINKQLSQYKALKNQGHFYRLHKLIQSTQEKFKSVPQLESFVTSMLDTLKSDAGKILMKADKLFDSGAFGGCQKVLKELPEAENSRKYADRLIDHCNSQVQLILKDLTQLEKSGDWDQLSKDLSQYKSKLSGVSLYDEKSLYWNTLFKSKLGKSMISADRYMQSGYVGKAFKSLSLILKNNEAGSSEALVKKLRQHCQNEAQSRVEELSTFEKSGDWFQLKEKLNQTKKYFSGMSAFDAKARHWEKQFKNKEIRDIIALGAKYHKVAATYLKKASGANAQKLQDFINRYPNSYYAKEARKLLNK